MKKAFSQFTYEVCVWVHCMELTLHVRAASTQDAGNRIRRELGTGAIVVAGPRRIDGATSAVYMRAIARTPANQIPAP